MNPLGTKVRFLRRVFADLVLQAFKLSFPDISEVPPFRDLGRFLVEENRHVKFLGKFLPESPSQRNAIIHRYSGYWYEGNNIDSAHSWVLAFVMSQVDKFDRLLASS